VVNGVVRRPEAMPHFTDDSLEKYAIGTQPEPDLGVIEEHLLICGECQDRLKVTDAYVAAMRSARKNRENREGEDSDVSPQAMSVRLPR
jgi:hypothetical protein